MYLLESPRRGDSNKDTKRMFSCRIIWKYQSKYTRSADLCADRIDVITNFAVISNVVIKRVHCITVCPPVRGDNPRASASGISPVQADKPCYN